MALRQRITDHRARCTVRRTLPATPAGLFDEIVPSNTDPDTNDLEVLIDKMVQVAIGHLDQAPELYHVAKQVRGFNAQELDRGIMRLAEAA